MSKALKNSLLTSFSHLPYFRACLLTVFLLCNTLAFAQPAPPNKDAKKTVTTPKPAPKPKPTPALTTQQKKSIELYLNTLKDKNAPLDRKRKAASLLFEKRWEKADTALKSILLYSNDIIARRAIVRAIADTDRPFPPNDQMLNTLMKVLDTPDSLFRDDLAAALGRFDEINLVTALISIASKADNPLNKRLSAIAALGHQRTRNSAKTLMTFISDKDKNIRPVAFNALAILTGNSERGPNFDEWNTWWNEAAQLSDARWQKALFNNLRKNNRRTQKRLDDLINRLVEQYNRRYDSADEKSGERQRVLEEMLASQQEPPIRISAMKLIDRRIRNVQKVDDKLRVAVRDQLLDSAPSIRAESARLLKTLADETAAKQIALLIQTESDKAVLSAYFSILTRMPQADAAKPIIDYIRNDELLTHAAAALLAHTAKFKLTKEHNATALNNLRTYLTKATLPDLSTIRILARIGENSDHNIIVNLLKHANATVRQTAVQTFATSTQPIEPVLPLLKDKAVASSVIAVIKARGSTEPVLTLLLAAKPPAAPAAPLKDWSAAVDAVAARLDAPNLIRIDTALIPQKPHLATHERILKVAAGLINGNGKPAAAEAHLLLTAFYFRNSNTPEAGKVLTALEKRKALSDPHRKRLAIFKIRLAIESGKIDDAVTQTKALLADPKAPPADLIAEPWIITTENAITARKSAIAKSLLVQLDTLFKGKVKPPTSARIARAQTQLKGMSKPPAGT